MKNFIESTTRLLSLSYISSSVNITRGYDIKQNLGKHYFYMLNGRVNITNFLHTYPNLIKTRKVPRIFNIKYLHNIEVENMKKKQLQDGSTQGMYKRRHMLYKI